jgi:hypothetical protein
VIDGYVNLDKREVSGYDVAASFDFPPTRFGDFSIGATGTLLEKFDEIRDGTTFDELRRNGNPEWCATGYLNWSSGPWESGWQLRYVDDVEDTSATNDTTGEFWPVDSWTSVNGFVSYRFENPAATFGGTELKLGVRNLFDELPPYADESAGYLSGLYSETGRVVYGEISKEF